jgi:hypothetical protein
VYGVSPAQGSTNLGREVLDANPSDIYTIAELCNERVADGFINRVEADIDVLHIGRVIEPGEYNDEIFYSYLPLKRTG